MSDQTLPLNDQSHLEVVYVLLLLQGAMGLLSGTAMLLFMAGSPAAFPLALGAPLLFFILAVGVTRGNRWARRAAIGTELIVVLAFGASFLLGLMAQVDMSFSFMTLLSSVVLPVTVINLLRRPARAPITATARTVRLELGTDRSEQAWAP